MISGQVKIGDEVWFVAFDSPGHPSALMVRMKVESLTYRGTTHERVQGRSLGPEADGTVSWDILSASCFYGRLEALSWAKVSLREEALKLQMKASALGFRL